MKTKLIPFAVALFAPWTLSADTAKPNIVFILMDNLGCGEVGRQGGDMPETLR